MGFGWSFPAPHHTSTHYTTHSDNVFQDILTVLSQASLQKLDGDTWLQRLHWLVQSSVTVFDTPLRKRKRDCDAINPSTRALKSRYYEAHSHIYNSTPARSYLVLPCRDKRHDLDFASHGVFLFILIRQYRFGPLSSLILNLYLLLLLPSSTYFSFGMHFFTNFSAQYPRLYDPSEFGVFSST
jgi:hypothetical protein